LIAVKILQKRELNRRKGSFPPPPGLLTFFPPGCGKLDFKRQKAAEKASDYKKIPRISISPYHFPTRYPIRECLTPWASARYEHEIHIYSHVIHTYYCL